MDMRTGTVFRSPSMRQRVMRAKRRMKRRKRTDSHVQ
jgi:hypothetical protein